MIHNVNPFTTMPESTDTVKLIEGSLALGFSLSEAIQRALGQSLSQFGRERGHGRSAVSMCLTFYGGRTFGNVRDDLAETLGVSREQIDNWIESQRETEKVSA